MQNVVDNHPLIDARKYFDIAIKALKQNDYANANGNFYAAIAAYEEYNKFLKNAEADIIALSRKNTPDVERDLLKLIHSCVQCGILEYALGKDDVTIKNSIKHFHKAIELSEQVKVKPSIIAEAYYYRGTLKDDNGKNVKNIETLNDFISAIQYGLDETKKDSASVAYLYCGLKFYYKSETEKCIEALMCSVDISPDPNDAKASLGYLGDMGVANYKPKKYKSLFKKENTTNDYFTTAKDEFDIHYKGRY